MAYEEANGDSRSYFRTPTPACDRLHKVLAEKIAADTALRDAFAEHGLAARSEVLQKGCTLKAARPSDSGT